MTKDETELLNMIPRDPALRASRRKLKRCLEIFGYFMVGGGRLFHAYISF